MVFELEFGTRYTKTSCIVYLVWCIVYFDTYTIQKILNFLIRNTYTIIKHLFKNLVQSIKIFLNRSKIISDL